MSRSGDDPSVRVRTLSERGAIRSALEADPYLHLYELGDLDPFFWPRTTWFARGGADDDLTSARPAPPVALLYRADALPVLLLFDRETGAARALLEEIRDLLPAPLYTHLSPELFGALAGRYRASSEGLYCKMSLWDPSALEGAPFRPELPIEVLASRDLEEVEAFYAAAYPGNWFEPRMLETGRYLGIRDAGELVAIAGVHVYSPEERIGVLGNVATRPDRRGRGLARDACRVLCQDLVGEGMRVGLNVARSNRAAIRCYESLGFVHEADYEERWLEERDHSSRESA